MRIKDGHLLGCHCPGCGDNPVPVMGWWCMGCGTASVRMLFLKSKQHKELLEHFTTYLRRWGHDVLFLDWKESNYDYPHQHDTEQVDAYEVFCRDCSRFFDVTLVNEKENRYALWHGFDSIVVGWIRDNVVETKINYNHDNVKLSSSEINKYVCKKLENLR